MSREEIAESREEIAEQVRELYNVTRNEFIADQADTLEIGQIHELSFAYMRDVYIPGVLDGINKVVYDTTGTRLHRHQWRVWNEVGGGDVALTAQNIHITGPRRSE